MFLLCGPPEGVEAINRCEGCGYWEPRHARAVNHIPTCPNCTVGIDNHRRVRHVRLWPAVRKQPTRFDPWYGQWI